jgi:hypothetical protein
VENEGNENPVAEPSRMMISMFNELNEDCQGGLKEELMEELKENLQNQFKEYPDNTHTKKT